MAPLQSKSQPPVFRTPSRSTDFSTCFDNARLAIDYLRECPRDSHRWEIALDCLDMFNSGCGGWKVAAPLIRALARELPLVSTLDPDLATFASARLALISTRFSGTDDSLQAMAKELGWTMKQKRQYIQPDPSFVDKQLVDSHLRYADMNENNIQGRRELSAAESATDSVKAAEHFEQAGWHFMVSGFASYALDSFERAKVFVLFSADTLASAYLLDWQADIHFNIEIARKLVLLSDVSFAYAKNNLKYDLSGVNLDPPDKFTPPDLTGSVLYAGLIFTPPGLTSSVLGATYMPVILPVEWEQPKQAPNSAQGNSPNGVQDNSKNSQ